MINYILIIILLIIILSNTIYCENFDNKDDSDKKSEDSFDESKIEDEINDNQWNDGFKFYQTIYPNGKLSNVVCSNLRLCYITIHVIYNI